MGVAVHQVKSQESAFIGDRDSLVLRLFGIVALLSVQQCSYLRFLKAGFISRYDRKFVCRGEKPSIALFLVCNRIYKEALPFFYARNQFKFSPATLGDLRTVLQNLNVEALRSISSLHLDLTHLSLNTDSSFVCKFPSTFDSLCVFLSKIISSDQLSSFSFVTSADSADLANQLASSVCRLPAAQSAAVSFGTLPKLRNLARSTSERLTKPRYLDVRPEKPIQFFASPQEIRFEILRHTALVPRWSRSNPNMMLAFCENVLVKHSVCCTSCTSVLNPCCCLTKPAAWSSTCDCNLDPRPLFLVCK